MLDKYAWNWSSKVYLHTITAIRGIDYVFTERHKENFREVYWKKHI